MSHWCGSRHPASAILSVLSPLWDLTYPADAQSHGHPGCGSPPCFSTCSSSGISVLLTLLIPQNDGILFCEVRCSQRSLFIWLLFWDRAEMEFLTWNLILLWTDVCYYCFSNTMLKPKFIYWVYRHEKAFLDFWKCMGVLGYILINTRTCIRGRDQISWL